jgi:spore coat protein U-like protein
MKLRSCSIFTAIGGFVFCACGLVSPASSQSCSFSVTNVAFGTADVTANLAVDTTATVSVTCSSILTLGFNVCVNLGAGSGGATNAANRFMQAGANTLTYGLFSDAARTTPWGSSLWAGGGANAVLVGFPITLVGSVTKNVTAYGRVYPGQQTVNAGSYLSTFSSTNAEIKWPVSNSSCTGSSSTATTTFNVTATVPTTCTIGTNNLNFGTAGVLTANTDATTTLSPVCTNGTPYNIGLDKGLNGSSVTARQMKAGAALINYFMFSNSGRTTNWGNTVGTDTVAGTGTGSAQSLTVYDRIPAQTTPAPGTYNDTIVVTLTY